MTRIRHMDSPVACDLVDSLCTTELSLGVVYLYSARRSWGPHPLPPTTHLLPLINIRAPLTPPRRFYAIFIALYITFMADLKSRLLNSRVPSAGISFFGGKNPPPTLLGYRWWIGYYQPALQKLYKCKDRLPSLLPITFKCVNVCNPTAVFETIIW